MKTTPYIIGLILAALALFFAYTGGYHSRSTFYVAAIASSYVVFSSLAIVVTRCGKTKSGKAWAFFASGIVLLFAYLPSLRFLTDLFYVPHGYDDMRIDRELFFYAPMIVSALCIYRGIAFWAEESLAKKEPN